LLWRADFGDASRIARLKRGPPQFNVTGELVASLSLRDASLRRCSSWRIISGEKSYRTGIVIHQKIGQNDLAAMAGIARDNVTRVLNDGQRHKVVSRLSSYYCIENKAQLENQVKL
jgi:hypothetical protein